MTHFDSSIVNALLFDLDGTLIDTDDQAVASLANRLAPFGRLFKLTPIQLARKLVMWAETPGNALVTLFDLIGVDDNIFAIGDRLRRWRGLSPRNNLPMVPGTGEMLHALYGRYRLGVVTTRGRRDAEAFLAQHGLAHLFDTVVTRESTRRLKPHPEPMYFAAEKLELAPNRCAMVGDTTPDMRSAQSAGAQAIGVLSGFGEQDELERTGAHVIIESVAQLWKVLPLDNFP